MLIVVGIYKERKEKDFRMVITPTGRARNGLLLLKDYAIVSYLSKEDKEKIGELILWALSQSDNEKIKNESEVKIEKQYFNVSSYRKLLRAYNSADFQFFNDRYRLELDMKDGNGYSPFKDENGNKYTVEFDQKPSALELGTKIIEMFEFKEKYDEDY